MNKKITKLLSVFIIAGAIGASAAGAAFAATGCKPKTQDQEQNQPGDDQNPGGDEQQPTVESVTVTAKDNATTINTGATLQLSAAVAGQNSPSQEVTWSIESTTSTDATVSTDGLLTAGTTAGQVVVKATSKADTSKSNTITITVAVPNTVTGVTVTAKNVLKVDRTISLTATVAGTGEYTQGVTWAITEGDDCATLDGSTLSGVKEGTVKVQATSEFDNNVKSAEFTITVAPLEIVEIANKEQFLAFRNTETPKDEYRLTADIDLTGVVLEAPKVVISEGVVFDGQGHKIMNAVYNNAAAKTGIFCALVNGGTVTDVKFLGCSVSSTNETAAILAGECEGKSTISKIEFNSCSIKCGNYGGFVAGRNEKGGANITVSEITAKNGCVLTCSQYGGMIVGDLQGSSVITAKDLHLDGEIKGSSGNGSFVVGRTRAGSTVTIENAVISAAIPNSNSFGLFSGNGACKKLTIKNVLVIKSNSALNYHKAPTAKEFVNLVTVAGVTVNESTAQNGENTPTYLKETLGFDFTDETGIWMTEGEGNAKYRLRAASTNVKSPDATITSIKVSTGNAKTRFKKGEEFDATGLGIMGVYSDGVQLVLNPDEGYTVDSTAFDGNTAGEYTITVNSVEQSAAGATVSATYTVTVAEQTGFEIIDEHMKHVYLVGDSLDTNNIVVKSIWSDGIKENLTSKEYTIAENSYDMSAAGTYNVSVTNSTFEAQTIAISVLNSMPQPVDGKVYVNVNANHAGANGERVNGVETFKSVKDAINFYETIGYEKDVVKVIYVGEGTYEDKITTDLANLVLIGEGKDEQGKYKSVLTYSAVESTVNPVSGKQYSLDCATLQVNGEGFRAYNLAIRNDFDYIHDNKKEASPQGLALTINGDKAVIENCYLYGNQDTLYLRNGRAYFKNTQIDGNIDFIFGEATGLAYFDTCTIKAINKSTVQEKNNGYVTAMKAEVTEKTNNKPDYGYIFKDCTLTDDGTLADGSMSLGRPWGNAATVAYIDCSFTKAYSTLAYDGSAKSRWYEMSGNSPVNADFVEYGSTGEGAITTAVTGGSVIDAAAAANYTKTNIFAATNGKCTWSAAWDCDAALTALHALTGATVAPTEIYVSATEITVQQGSKADLGIGVAPWNANDKTVTVTVADPTVAAWENGVLSGLKQGATTITVTKDGLTAKTISVTVSAPPATVEKTYTFSYSAIDKNTLTPPKPEAPNELDKAVLTSEHFTGVNAFLKVVKEKAVTWRKSNSCIENKDGGLAVTFKGTGTITITFTSTSSKNKSRLGLQDDTGTYVKGVGAVVDDGGLITEVTSGAEAGSFECGDGLENGKGGKKVSATFTITKAGTYTIVCPSATLGRGARIMAIVMVDNEPTA